MSRTVRRIWHRCPVELAICNLQKNSNCTVEIVNYKNEQIEKEKSRWESLFNNNVIKELARNLLTTPYYLKLDKVFSGFVNKYLTADNEIKKEDLSSLKYDLYLVGSDQVWNLTLTGNDKTFFCDFAMPESICCSYAASIGSSAFSNEELQNYKQLIDRFALISFREKELVPIFEKIASEKKICSVVDPVFLLKQDEWNSMASSIVRKPYVLFFCVGYNAELDQTLEFAKNLANEKNMELLYLSNQDIWYKHRELHHCGAASPCEFLGYIRNASYVVTNSFHATAFSIIFHREFYSEIGLKRNGRIKNILNLTGLQDHAINRGINKENTLKGKIDWSKVDVRLNLEKEISLEGFKKFQEDSLYIFEHNGNIQISEFYRKQKTYINLLWFVKNTLQSKYKYNLFLSSDFNWRWTKQEIIHKKNDGIEASYTYIFDSLINQQEIAFSLDELNQIFKVNPLLFLKGNI